MNARVPSPNLVQQTLTTVFTSGNSQAVRLPKEFRLNSKQVIIERRGDEIVLREKKRSLGEALRDAFADLPPLSDEEARAFDDAMASVMDLGPAEERAMWTDPTFWDLADADSQAASRKKTPNATAKRRTAKPKQS